MGIWSIGEQQLNRAMAGGMPGSGNQRREALALPSPLFGYSFAVLLAVFAQIARIPLHPQSLMPFITYVPFIVFAAWYCGVGPGLVNTVICTLECIYFAIEPVNTWAAADWQHWVGVAILLLTGLISGLLFDSLRKALRSDALARSRADVLRNLMVAIVDSCDEAIIGIDLNGAIVSWNHSAEKMYGYSASEAIGQLITFFMTRVSADEELALEAKIRRGERVDHYETRRKRKDGTEIIVSVTASAVKDASGQIVGISKISRDITEQKRNDAIRARQAKELMIQTTLLSGIVEHSPAAIAVLGGPEFTFEMVNPSYEAFQPGVAMAGRTVREIWPDAAPIVLPLLRRVRDTRAPYHATAMAIPRRPAPDAPVEERYFTFSYVPLLGLNGGNEPKILVVAVEVTDLKQSEISLQERENFISGILGSITDAFVVLDKDWRYRFANEEFLRRAGMSQPEPLGRNAWDLFPEFVGTDQDRQMHHAMADRVPVEYEFYHQRFGGWFSARAYPTPDGGLAVFSRDITERKKAEDTVRESELRYRTLAAATSDVLYRMSPDWSVMRQLRGKDFIADTEAPDSDWLQKYIHPDDQPRVMDAINTAIATKSIFELEHRVLRVDGTLGWTSSRAIPLLGADGEIFEWFGAAVDITERKRAEEQIRRFNAELEYRVRERTAQLEASNKELESFTYSVSHDLRAPLRGIDGWSFALLEDYGDKLDKQAHEYLGRVRSETQRMGHLIDDLLNLSRVTRAEMNPTRVDLSAMANSITSRIREANPDRNTKFLIEPGLTAEGDPRLLDVALTNLLDNAAKFSSKRADAKVEFGAMHQSASSTRRPQFFVRDNGAGFDMAYASQLFGPFQRLHSASEFAGTGIGLATVQRVILRHGGTISAESKPDQGATFYFTIGGAN